ncbi:unnamed protein product [Polarella glacialis]|uniref:SPX domain-containing protein n=1 Tax=Polarella glacialis TaxID=89957 RepID=A0A813JMA0_POLGL|nr:unnamed protein product [Polarella glacialis]
MKFSKLLEEYQLPEWRGTYLPYYFLKTRLKEIASGRLDAAAKGLRTRPWSTSETGAGASTSRAADAHRRRLDFLALLSEGSSFSQDAVAEAWQAYLDSEVLRVDACVQRGLEALRCQFGDLEQLPWPSSENLQADIARGTSATKFVDLNVLQALGRVSEGLYRLRGYAELNHAAVYKILKKYGKQLHRSDTCFETLYPKIMEGTHFADMSQFDNLDAQIRQAFLHRSPCQGLAVSPEVAHLAAGLGSRGPAGLGGSALGVAQGPALRSERLLFFFLGSSLALFLAILVLIALPPKDPDTFFVSYFLTSFPVFRVVCSVLLVIWGMGAVSRVCEDNFINHMFILGIDPRCQVSANFLFSLAGLLTSIWILIFGMYVVDYKWKVLPRDMGDTGFKPRSSWHYVLYPAVLLGLTLLILLRPSRICRCRYKAQLLAGVGRTCAAPFYAVTFGDNLIGDVLTSLAKPLQDVMPAMCYLFSHHPQVQTSLDAFFEHGNTCPQWESLIVAPIIGGAPFLFRLFQCARRFRDTGQRNHLLNFGKYAASLLVVIVSRLHPSTFAIVSTSVVATAYAVIWDVSMDWGLSAHDLRLLARLPVASPALSGTTSLLQPPMDRQTSVSSAHSFQAAAHSHPDAPQSPARSTGPLQRRFSPQTYWMAVITDVLLRLTWVITLMPITLLSDDIVQRDVLYSTVFSAEIFRRTLWAILRIEHEQVANASGYRALLWVPMKLSHPDGDQPAPTAGPLNNFQRPLLPQ